MLSQIDARLFHAYAKPTVDLLTELISKGIASPAWVPTADRPTAAMGYVYDVLLTLVLVHSEVTSTCGTASTLTNQVLSYLLEQCSTALLNAFKSRTTAPIPPSTTPTPFHYSLPALMQATLDVEFLAQTLNQFTTDKAGEVQSQIYLALDERTSDEARGKLQSELPAMRNVLKKLREGTKGEFVCFRKERRGRAGGTGGGGR